MRPDLKWFADDLEMLSLIDMRCGNNPNSIKKYSIKIDSSKYSALKKDQAAKIDAALKGVKIKSGAKMKQRAQSESQKAMLFEIEF